MLLTDRVHVPASRGNCGNAKQNVIDFGKNVTDGQRIWLILAEWRRKLEQNCGAGG